MNYNVIIVEDEKHQQESLTNLLGEFSEFHLRGIASTVDEAKQLIETTKPDLAFLDVMLGSHKSFEILENKNNFHFEIIFTTAYEEHAVKAFRFSAIDYLLKPIVREELVVALDKFKRGKNAEERASQIQNMLTNFRLPHNNHRIALPTLTGFMYVQVKDIVRCESDNTYTTFFTTDKRRMVVSKTLKEVEQMLTETDYRFFRVHNSHLINLEYIAEYIKGEGGMVKMTDGSQIDVSRRRKDEFLHQLKN
ncbi:MAG: response regulator transcription factor [Bacteroidetes bacterium]|nr:response regulator transcription factor [Bacteroidota bacterium]